MNLADHAFALLLRRAIPMVMAPPGALPPAGPQLRGVVRHGSECARVLYSPDSAMTHGVGFEFELVADGHGMNVQAALDWVRAVVATRSIEPGSSEFARTKDSHGNLIVMADRAGFDPVAGGPWYDQNLFSMLSIFVHGGGFPWFEEFYSCMGFMLTGSDRCRIYIRVESSGDTYGLDMPLMSSDGRVPTGMGGSLPQEVASLVGSGGLSNLPRLDVRDDYSSIVIEMTSWVR